MKVIGQDLFYFYFLKKELLIFVKIAWSVDFYYLRHILKKNNRKNHNLKAFNCNIRILIFRNCILVFVI